jgi:NAD(P)H dehydrogenase (quinone)
MIAVLGASGRVGRHVAAGLADAGVPARALVRYPDRVDLPIPAVHADLRRPATLPDALRGVERLLLLTPHVPEQDLLEAAAVDAAASAG